MRSDVNQLQQREELVDAGMLADDDVDVTDRDISVSG